MKGTLGLILGVMLFCGGVVWSQGQSPSTPEKGSMSMRFMEITGAIDKLDQGYIIRGESPSEIFTILNPKPEVLDNYVEAGKAVAVEVRIVSGDNVEIVKIGKKPY